MAAPGVLVAASLGHHDVGGSAQHVTGKSMDTSDPPVCFWEQRVHALECLLEDHEDIKFKADELRAGIEALPQNIYTSAPYYGRWALSIARAMERRGFVKMADLEEVLGVGSPPTAGARFREGDYVTVRHERDIWPMPYRKPHLRTPGYVHGVTGKVVKSLGKQEDPNANAFLQCKIPTHVYSVRFWSSALWPLAAAGDRGAKADGGENGACVDVDIYEPWLVAGSAEACRGLEGGLLRMGSSDDSFASAAIGNPSPKRRRIELEAQAKECPDIERAPSVSAYETFATGLIDRLIRNGLFKAEDLHHEVEAWNVRSVDPLGPKLVARAWLDPAFKQLLSCDADAAVKAMNDGKGLGAILDSHNHADDQHDDEVHRDLAGGHAVDKVAVGSRLIALENTADVHNVVVCTLCSCYPLAVLGYAPAWYKSIAYRVRMVREPRVVLAEFGLELPPQVQVRVHDSLSEKRYIVLPQRPAGTEGWSESDLRALVTRDCMVGVGLARPAVAA